MTPHVSLLNLNPIERNKQKDEDQKIGSFTDINCTGGHDLCSNHWLFTSQCFTSKIIGKFDSKGQTHLTSLLPLYHCRMEMGKTKSHFLYTVCIAKENLILSVNYVCYGASQLHNLSSVLRFPYMQDGNYSHIF